MSQIVCNLISAKDCSEAVLTLNNDDDAGFRLLLQIFISENDGDIGEASCAEFAVDNNDLNHLADMLALMSRMIKNKLLED